MSARPTFALHQFVQLQRKAVLAGRTAEMWIFGQ